MTVAPQTFDEAARLNEIADEITSGGSVDDPSTPVVLPSLDLPPNGNIRLPGGWLPGLDISKVVYDATVRELTGLDEELIEKARQTGRIDRFLNAILVAGVETIGEQVATEDVLDGLLLGDRDFLLLEIRRATYGPEIEYHDLTCPWCNKPLDPHVTIDEIPSTPLSSPTARFFDVPLRSGAVAECRLPTGGDQAFIFGQETQTNAEVNNLLLSRCVLSIKQKDGTSEAVAGSLSLVRNIGIVDRRNILEALTEKQPGPRYDGVIVTHDLCEKEVPFAVGVGDLFPDM